MFGKKYLKKVNMLLSDTTAFSEMEETVEKLRRQGLQVCVRTTQEPMAAEEETLYLSDSPRVQAESAQKNLPSLFWLRKAGGDGMACGAAYAFEEAPAIDREYLERVYRRFRGLPWDILETERCLLRETVEADVDALREICLEPAVARYMEDLYPTREEEMAYIRKYAEQMYSFYEFGVWTVLLKETGEVIGRAGLSVREGYELPELGYVIGVPWQRRGLAEEVCRAILAYAEAEFAFPAVQALIREENTASVRLAQKLGFQLLEARADGTLLYRLQLRADASEGYI